MDIAKATPAEIDTRAAELNSLIDQIGYSLKRAQYTDASYRLKDIRAALARIRELEDQLSAALVELGPLRAEYSHRGGWTRYYMVDNSNGHLHTNTSCRNTYASTQWHQMVAMSGLTRAEAVELGGKISCLTCFPGFREEIEKGRLPKIESPRQQATREEREAREAKAAELKARDAAKAIFDLDGTVLLNEDGQPLKTVVAARNEAMRELEWVGLSKIYADQARDEDDEHTPERVVRMLQQTKNHEVEAARLIRVIAAKLGRTYEDLAAEYQKKNDKKQAAMRKQEADRKAQGIKPSEYYR